MDDQVHMIVPMLIQRRGSLRVHITRSLCQQRGIHSDISSHSVPEVMPHCLLVVVGSMVIVLDDSIPMIHPIRLQLHGRESSLFPPITMSTSISIQDSTHNSRLSRAADRSVSVPRSQTDIWSYQDLLSVRRALLSHS